MSNSEFNQKVKTGLKNGQFVLHYQPKIDLNNGRICGLEALLRWNDPENGLLSPNEFIPQIEESGLIIEVGAWVLAKAMSDFSLWRLQGLAPPRIAVNVSQAQLESSDFVEMVRGVLENTGAMIGCLELEITESMVMQHVEVNIKKMHDIRAMGVNISIDDFGTGYSSLSYLKRFPATSVKIDQSFVRDITTNPNDAALARSIISMAHEMGLRVVAEGVETEGQLNFLSRHHCDEIQGYYISEALPEDKLIEFLEQYAGLPNIQTISTLKDRTLLLVDDEVNITTSIRRLMRGEGYKILIANSGKQGLEVLANNDVGVIISDQRMPEMTGVEFLRVVKKIYPDTIRIVLSGYTDLKSITEAINEGAIYKFLTKPWEDENLLTNVREAFQYYDLKSENARLDRENQLAYQELAATHRDLEAYAQLKSEEVMHSVKALQVSQQILEHIPYPVLGIDDDELIVIANAAANQLFTENKIPILGLIAHDLEALQFSQYKDIPENSWQEIEFTDGRRLNVICHRMNDYGQSSGSMYFFQLLK